MKPHLSRIGFVALLAVLGWFAVSSLQGPHGVFALMKKQEEIRELERQNAEMARRNQTKAATIEELNKTRAELYIRGRYKKLRKNETMFVVPPGRTETPAAALGAVPAAPPEAQTNE
jgi:cell division protein FtsB